MIAHQDKPYPAKQRKQGGPRGQGVVVVVVVAARATEDSGGTVNHSFSFPKDRLSITLNNDSFTSWPLS